MNCATCEKTFQPKPGGHNARYCSDTCKRRKQYQRLRATRPEQFKVRQMRNHAAVRANPVRLARHQAQGRAQRRRVREWLAAYKLERGCKDCGFRAHAAALQLDHEGPKAVEISEARSSIGRLKAEIESGQCVVRCANCHSIKTWERKQFSGKDGGPDQASVTPPEVPATPSEQVEGLRTA